MVYLVVFKTPQVVFRSLYVISSILPLSEYESFPLSEYEVAFG